MHNPGKFTDKRGQNKQPAPILQTAPVVYFGEGVQPCHDFVLIECRFVGGSADSKVVIPDSVQQEQQFAIVRAVGPGRYLASGAIVPPPCKVGDYVYAAISHPEARRIEIEGKKQVLLPGHLILCIFPDIPKAYKDAMARQDELAAEKCTPKTEPPAQEAAATE